VPVVAPMPRLEQLRDRLPSLYRPDEDDSSSLLARYLKSVAHVLETLNREAGEVLQAHWFEFADRALYSPYYIRDLQLRHQPFPRPNDSALAELPFIHDLARLGSLLALPPWQEPAAERERVEEYRKRIARIVSLYTQGLGTTGALRRMVEAQLPADRASASGPDRPFTLEEYAPLVTQSLAVQMPGEPLDLVGPLMRWSVTNDGVNAASLTVYVEGVQPVEGLVEPTRDPVIELYAAGGTLVRRGIAFRGTLDPGQVLRLRPSALSWLGTENGVQRAEALPSETAPADPTAPGPWQPVGDGGPGGSVVALLQVSDGGLWAAANAEGAGALWRFDGQTWAEALDGLSLLRCLLEDGQSLLVGTEDGLRRVVLYPPEGEAFTAAALTGPEHADVQAILRADDGRIWLGLADGASVLGPGDAVQPAPLEGTGVLGIAQDRAGTLYFGTELGLFQYQPTLDDWYWYAGAHTNDAEEDWEPFAPEQSGAARNVPEAARVFLPPVRCVLRGPDAALWLGTERGIARYVARSSGPAAGLTYETILEAFPDLTTGPVYAIAEDARGQVWFGTDRGLFRFDGRDWWQHQTDVWVNLGRASPAASDTSAPRFAWRFDRASASWQRRDPRAGGSNWTAVTSPPRSTAEPAVRSILWSDGVVGEIGQWGSDRFVNGTAVESSLLVARYKPDAQRILAGGIPAMPRLPVGESVWRYLALEPAEAPEVTERPFWTIEGRLLPPPPDHAAPPPGRFDQELPPPASTFDEAVFPYPPSARVRFEWGPRRLLGVLVRLYRRAPDENFDPVVLDRVWQGIQQVRPAGVRAALAIDNEIVRGGEHGATG